MPEGGYANSDRMRTVFQCCGDNWKSNKNGIARGVASRLGMHNEQFDFTLPEARLEVRRFTPDTLVISGTPVYAGRVPNVLLRYLTTGRRTGRFGPTNSGIWEQTF